MAAHKPETPASHDTMLRAMRAYGAASRQLNAWIAGEQALGLLLAAQTSGILDATMTPRTADDIAATTGVDGPRVADILRALDAHGVVVREGERYRLAPDYALLLAPDAFQPLPDLLARSATLARVLEASAAPERAYTGLAGEEALVLAQGLAPNPLSPAFVAYWAGLSAQLPELRARWDAGGRHIEFGCGAGGALLGVAAAHPRLTAVGIEISPAVIPETRRRAAAGVADRVEVRQGDACDGAEAAAYDSAFWAQQFFPAASRSATLAALVRTLKPGGFLLLPTFASGEPPADDEALHAPAGQAYALSRVRFGHWGVPALTVEALRAEAEAAGFAYLRRAPAPFPGSFILLLQSPA